MHKSRSAGAGRKPICSPICAKKKSGTKFGDQLDHRFRRLMQTQLNGNPEGKVFHSFRHYFTTQLGWMKDIPEQVRKDTLEDLQTVFTHPVWHGCKDKTRWQKPAGGWFRTGSIGCL